MPLLKKEKIPVFSFKRNLAEIAREFTLLIGMRRDELKSLFCVFYSSSRRGFIGIFFVETAPSPPGTTTAGFVFGLDLVQLGL